MVIDRKKYKRYDPALIERARALGEEIGATRAARVLGLSRDIIETWIRRKRDGNPMSIKDGPEQRELLEAKQELRKLKRENDDLKKANIILKELASFFSKDHPHTSSEWSLNSKSKK
jgi:transposase-like protein